MSVEKIRNTIREIREETKKYGMLVSDRKCTWPEVLEILEYYEQGGETEAVKEADEKVAEMKSRLAKAQGATGGLTKRINKLEEKLAELQNVKENNKRLSRVTTNAADLIEYLENHPMVDAHGDSLADLPLYARLAQELTHDVRG